ncbi:MAG: hydroxyacylglutathione hydrolase [Acetobacteraceae bacterium]
MLHVRPVPMLADNYGWLLQDAAGFTIFVDPAEDRPAAAAVEAGGGRLDMILLTHHHADHVAGTDALRGRFGAKVAGGAADAYRLPALDHPLSPGQHLALGSTAAEVIATPGHTRGHIAFFFPSQPVLVVGDTIFSLGCGRLVEGTAEEMFASLQRLSRLPGESLVCCGHEYTLANARFALALRPDDPALKARADEAQRSRAAGAPTVPTRLEDERRLNPFLLASDAAEFARIRALKDRF